MNKNKLIIAAAGSGKTTYLVNQAIECCNEKVLITTYTIENEIEIRSKIIELCKCIPSHITILTWFSLLIHHGVKPYQGSLNCSLFDNNVNGLILVNEKSGFKGNYAGNPLYYAEDTEFKNHYFTNNWKIFSDKLSKLVCRANENTNGEVINRLSRIYPNIFIDEIQDLAGYDLEIVKLLFKSQSRITLVGDPRQVTYLTHNEAKHKKYTEGKIKQFLLDNCKSLINNSIDETTLSVSHRNNQGICNFSSKLYPELPKTIPCDCMQCRSSHPNHLGIYLVRKSDVSNYLREHKPVQLRWDVRTITNPNYPSMNFGESKGKTFDNVLIYPTKSMESWIYDSNINLNNAARAKLYVAITRAKFSVAIISNFTDGINIDGVKPYIPN
jgi:DNA helicase-2/ATP-dependent DNA helicase PcrA